MDPSDEDIAQPDVAGLCAGLEPAQRVAVLADDPVVCVLAGAGTGKTRVLTLRVARRVEDRSAHPSHVLVATFSRKAADELRTRLWSLGVGAQVQAGTLHRTALRLIAQYRSERRMPAPSIVPDRRALLAAALFDQGTTRAGAPARATPARRTDLARLDAEIGWAKARLVVPSDYEDAARRAGRRPGVSVARVVDAFARYEALRRRRGLLDLDDLLIHCGDVLEDDEGFAQVVRWWHRHVFVDEMQDLNDAQFRLLRLLVGDEPDLFVVGDPNQSVYGWNGADPAILRRVAECFAGTRVVRLETNHRCRAPVLRVASAALGLPSAAPAVRGDGPVPVVAGLDTDDDEARWVARRIWLAHGPGRRWSSMAVLARTNAQLTRIARALDAEHIPTRLAGGDLGPASDVREEPREPHGSDADAAGELTEGVQPLDDPVDDGVPQHHGDDDRVVLSTFHRAKGLQWRTVFVVGLSDGLVPHASARTRAAKDEERRLLYVALTRAEDELTCSWARHADDEAAAGRERRPSPWLAAIEHQGEVMRAEAAAPDADAGAHLARIRALLGPPQGAGAPR